MFLYKLTNRKTGLSYIGATTRKRFHERLRLHHDRADRGDRHSALHVAIREDGWDSFDVMILAEPKTRTELLAMEEAAIAAAGTLAPNGYNMTAGGLGMKCYRFSAESRAKMAQAKEHYRPWNTGLKTGPMSATARQKMSDAHKGKKPWNVGIPHSAETRAKLSVAAPHGAAQWQARPLEYEGVRYECIRDACRATGLSVMQIRYRLQTGRAKDLRPKEN